MLVCVAAGDDASVAAIPLVDNVGVVSRLTIVCIFTNLFSFLQLFLTPSDPLRSAAAIQSPPRDSSSSQSGMPSAERL